MAHSLKIPLKDPDLAGVADVAALRPELDPVAVFPGGNAAVGHPILLQRRRCHEQEHAQGNREEDVQSGNHCLRSNLMPDDFSVGIRQCSAMLEYLMLT